METPDRKKHWEHIYNTRPLHEVSWYQPKPSTSLELIAQCAPSCNAKIIDVGGGDSLLVDHLLELGYTDITVLDISEAAIERAKERLGPLAAKVSWIVADAAHYEPDADYDVWHDRAAFHFLSDEQEVQQYIRTAHRALRSEGQLIIGTFSVNGPEKCSGISIKQYSEHSMQQQFAPFFTKKECMVLDHLTPSGKVQNFLFCTFSKTEIP